MSTQDTPQLRFSYTFRKASTGAQSPAAPKKTPGPPAPKKKHHTPFSLRLSEEERAYLEEKAGSRPLGAYIRNQLLGEQAQQRRALRKPSLGDEQYAALLAALGQSRLSSNLNQLAHHANAGNLDLSADSLLKLKEACEAVVDMRKALLTALGLKGDGG